MEERHEPIVMAQRLAPLPGAGERRHELPVRLLVELVGVHHRPLDGGGFLVRRGFGEVRA